MTSLRGCLLALGLMGMTAGCTVPPEPVQGPSMTPSVSGTAFPTTSPSGGGSRPTASAPLDTPTPGSVDQTVEAKPQTTSSPIKLKSPYRAAGVEVALTSIRRLQMKGMGPGEISGPALRITVRVSNYTDTAISIDSAVVNLTDSKGRVGTPYAGSPARPLAGTIDAGRKATGVYVFSVKKSARSPITVTVTYEPGAETALFVGNAS